ncbi:MAG: site-specific integrase [Sandaracinaceae bacterium]|nr:site-specific integrase [Sandaracinaceae bacterium]
MERTVAPQRTACAGADLRRVLGGVLGTYVAANNKHSERDAKKSIIDRHLVPAFGPLRLDQIGPREIETLRAAMREAKFGAKRINNVVGCLMKLLEYAHEVGLIAKPRRVKPLRVPPQKYDFLDVPEYARLLRAAEHDPQTYAMILVAGDAGLRLGEVMALGWTDVDLTAKRLTVSRSAWNRGKVEHLDAPKSGRDRRIDMSNRLVEALKAIRHLRGDRIFVRPGGKYMTPKTMESALHYTCRKAGIRLISWHKLRHTFASHLAMDNADIKTIQEYMGHSTVAMTLKYMHLAPGHKREAIDRLERTRTAQHGQLLGSATNDNSDSTKKTG